ncbi:hypothetical protein EDC96DRAFT_572914 [Choanephora cucurbitarum]|nr:hypothetical protein EDC96DRAFT_572914 [Choanephora cucurbitarum]
MGYHGFQFRSVFPRTHRLPPVFDWIQNNTVSSSVDNMSVFSEQEEAESHDEEPVVKDHPEEFVERDENQDAL